MTDIPTITQEEAVEVREKVARAIDPAWWDWADRFFDASIPRDVEHREFQLTRADRAIIAALSPNMDHAVGGVREAKISPHTGTDCDPDAHQWVRNKWGANPNRFQFTAWHMADAYQAGKNAAAQISFDERVAYEDRVLSVEMRAERLKRLIPPPSGPGSYVGDTYYPAGGTEASHRWDGAKWVWMANLVEASDEDA